MQITSSAFEQGQPIPKKYAYRAENVSPPLKFVDVPEGTETLALIVDDPDAPGQIFVHWVLWNIPGPTEELPEGAKVGNEGTNHYGKIGYDGPNPPSGTHRYYFKLYALNTTLALPEGTSKNRLEHAMKDHVLATAELMGTYQQ